MVAAVHLEDDNLAARQLPLRVEVAPPPSSVAPNHLTVRRHKSESPTQRRQVQLTDGLGTIRDINQGEPHVRLVPHPADRTQLGLEARSRRQPPLHHRSKHQARKPGKRLPGCGIDRRALNPGARQTSAPGDVFRPQPPRLVYANTGELAHLRTSGDDDVNLLGFPGQGRKAGELKCGVAAQRHETLRIE